MRNGQWPQKPSESRVWKFSSIFMKTSSNESFGNCTLILQHFKNLLLSKEQIEYCNYLIQSHKRLDVLKTISLFNQKYPDKKLTQSNI